MTNKLTSDKILSAIEGTDFLLAQTRRLVRLEKPNRFLNGNPKVAFLIGGEMKTCYKCKQEKPLSEFYRYKKWWQSYCKQCTKLRDKTRRRDRAEYYQSDQYKLINRRKVAKHNKIHPDRCEARKLANCKFKISQPCQVCGQKAEKHHEDYSKPLEVMWLCEKHHLEKHNPPKEK